MKKPLVMLFALSNIAACSTTPVSKTPNFHSNIHQVSQDEMAKYWVVKGRPVYFELPIRNQREFECGFVVVRLIIDSDGIAFNPEIVDSQPAAMHHHSALFALSRLDYLPAKTNPDRIPIQVDFRVEFTREDKRC